MRSLVLILAVVGVAFAADPQPKIRPGQNLSDVAAQPTVSVGSEVGYVAFRDVQGKTHYLDAQLENGLAVFVFSSTECPVALRYTQRLNRLQKEFAPKNVAFYAVYANEEDTKKGVIAHGQDAKLGLTLVHDQHGYLARKLGASMTPQVFVVGPHRELLYRGAIDDHRIETRVKRSYLREALSALVAKKPLALTQTKAQGCTLSRPKPSEIEKVTYSAHIAPILRDHCVGCHRPGQVAPFSLTSYAKAKRFATEIDAYTHSRLMPPWKPVAGFGSFRNELGLSDEELALLRHWKKAGAAEGNKKDLPPKAKFDSEWALGQPDLIIEMPEEYTLGAEGEDDYRHFIIPSNFAKDMYVEAIDVRPGNTKIVHHVIAYVDTTGQARELDKADPGPGYTKFGGTGFEVASLLGGWAPGTTPLTVPKGTGAWLPKGGDIVLQVHYYRTGKVEKDRTRVGLYFSKDPKPARVHNASAVNDSFVLPPGAANHRVDAEWVAEADVYAVWAFPHMHLLGREMKVIAEKPDGKVMPIIWVKNWDFNWQTGYQFKKPMYLPKGTKVKVVAHFDNSSKNPNNPNDPPKPIRWGEKTTDEMCIAFLGIVSARQYGPKRKAEKVTTQR